MASNNNQVVVIDYEMGNLFSVKRACENVALHPLVTSDAADINTSDAMILPGVGAFGDAMANLKRLDLVSPIRDFIASGRPFMGICLGLQLLMSESEEFGRHKGLDVIKGGVVKFPTLSRDQLVIKVPQVGWNRITRPLDADEDLWQKSPLHGIINNEYMYFVHSFYIVTDDPGMTLSYTNYEGTEYASSVHLNNVFACQFHPEKSSTEGMKIYENFALLVKRGKENYE